MREDSLSRQNKDAKIITALKEQVNKLKKLAQVKTAIVYEEKRIREELIQEKEASKVLSEHLASA